MKLVAPAVTALLLLTIAKIAEPLLMTSGENQKGFRNATWRFASLFYL
jgi:hypothetical protein